MFLWRVFQLFKAYRGQQDFLRWLARFSVLRKRLAESWMDLLEPAGHNDPTFVGQVLANAAQMPQETANKLIKQPMMLCLTNSIEQEEGNTEKESLYRTTFSR